MYIKDYNEYLNEESVLVSTLISTVLSILVFIILPKILGISKKINDKLKFKKLCNILSSYNDINIKHELLPIYNLYLKRKQGLNDDRIKEDIITKLFDLDRYFQKTLKSEDYLFWLKYIYNITTNKGTLDTELFTKYMNDNGYGKKQIKK